MLLKERIGYHWVHPISLRLLISFTGYWFGGCNFYHVLENPYKGPKRQRWPFFSQVLQESERFLMAIIKKRTFILQYTMQSEPETLVIISCAPYLAHYRLACYRLLLLYMGVEKK
jgi:hypothetical protein